MKSGYYFIPQKQTQNREVGLKGKKSLQQHKAYINIINGYVIIIYTIVLLLGTVFSFLADLADLSLLLSYILIGLHVTFGLIIFSMPP